MDNVGSFFARSSFVLSHPFRNEREMDGAPSLIAGEKHD